jgi:hypothetical protein
MKFISAVFVSMSIFHSDAEVMGLLQYYILSIETVFGLNMNFNTLFGTPKICKKILIFKLCPFPLRIKFYVPLMWNYLCLFQPARSMIFKNFISDWNPSLIMPLLWILMEIFSFQKFF